MKNMRLIRWYDMAEGQPSVASCNTFELLFAELIKGKVCLIRKVIMAVIPTVTSSDLITFFFTACIRVQTSPRFPTSIRKNSVRA